MKKTTVSFDAGYFERILTVAAGIILIALLIVQARSLYTAPMPDSIQWYGDETWLMQEFQTQIHEGVFRNPIAPQSSIFHNNGILLNSLWLNALVYGVPENVFSPHFSPVAIGRTVTMVLTVLLLVYAYWMQRRWGVTSLVAMTTCIVLASNRAFFNASHSARYDLWVALGALVALDYFVYLFYTIRNGTHLDFWKKVSVALFPTLCLAWNLHIVRMEFLPYLFLLLVIGVKNTRTSFLLFASALGILILLLIPSFVLTSSWNLVHYGSRASRLDEALGNIPAVKLFSLSVLKSTVLERFRGIQVQAPFALYGALLSITFGIIMLFTRIRKSKSRESAIFIFLLLSCISWAISLRFVSYYAIDVLPMLVVAGAALGYTGYKRIAHTTARWSIGFAYLFLIVFAAYGAVSDASIAQKRGTMITDSTNRALSNAISLIRKERTVPIPTVLAPLSLMNQLLTVPGIHAIDALYREYPDTPLTLNQFLLVEHVNFILDKRSPVFTDLAATLTSDSLLNAAQRVALCPSEISFDYFHDGPIFTDTLVLLQVK